MTNQEKKKELNKYREAEAQAARLREEIRRLYSKAEQTTATLRMVPGGGRGGNRIESAVEAIDELATRFGEKQIEAVALRRTLEDAIAAVPDGRLRMLLRYRYVDGMKWEQIETQMNYGKTQLWRLHGEALTALKME